MTAEDRTPPHDTAAEREVLGAAMIHQDTADDLIADGLKPGDFYRPSHELVWSAIVALRASGEPCEPRAVAGWLMAAGSIREAGGPAELHALTHELVTHVNAGYYARKVKRCAHMRAVIRAGQRIALGGFDAAADPESVLTSGYSELADLSEVISGAGESRDIHEIIDEAIDEIENGIEFHPHGLPEVDDLIEGFCPGSLNVIAARPSVGKTAIALQAAIHMSLTCGLPVGFSSLEMGPSELLHRAFSQVSRVSYTKIRLNRHGGENTLSEAEWRAIGEASKAVSDAPLEIRYQSGTSVATIRHEIRRATLKFGTAPAAWFIDYLQLLTASNTRVSREQQVGQMTRELKLLAKETGVAMVVLAQLNREGAKTGRQPVLTDLRESGSIEQDADRVLLLHRDLSGEEGADPSEMVLIVAKNRQGMCGTRTARWDGTRQSIWGNQWRPHTADSRYAEAG